QEGAEVLAPYSQPQGGSAFFRLWSHVIDEAAWGSCAAIGKRCIQITGSFQAGTWAARLRKPLKILLKTHRTELRKPVITHSLRHAFTVHLLEPTNQLD